MSQALIHYGIHFGLPLIIALVFYRSKLWYAYGMMMMGMLIDLDHLLASPIFDPDRCSINFHPLHSYWAITVYISLCFPRKTRLIGLGLLIHIIADTADCLWMQF